MELKDIFSRRIVLFGYGRMGGALLDGWIKSGLDLENIVVYEINPNRRLLALEEKGIILNPKQKITADICIFAVKPQGLEDLLMNFPKNINFSLLVSVIAGTPISKFVTKFGDKVNIVRTMPNTPSLVSAGITAIVGQKKCTKEELAKVDLLMSAVGQTVRLKEEAEIDIVTAISGSGPAYIFLLIEAMVSTGVELGLSRELSLKLAKQTVFGAGKLIVASDTSPESLRENVTSPGGTTEAALKILLENNVFKDLMKNAIKAAHNRSLELRA